MSKFCMFCGAEMNDADTVCPSCGGTQEEPVTAEVVQPEGGDQKNKNLMIVGIAAAAAVVLIVAVILANVVFGSSYKDPIDNMIKSMETGKGKYIYKAIPEFVLDEEFEDYTKREIIDELDEYAEEFQENLEDEYGDHVKIKLEYKSKKKIDKDDIEDMEDDIEDEFDKKVRISKGYKVKVKVKVRGEDDHDTETLKIAVYKIKGKWYLLEDGFDVFF